MEITNQKYEQLIDQIEALVRRNRENRRKIRHLRNWLFLLFLLLVAYAGWDQWWPKTIAAKQVVIYDSFGDVRSVWGMTPDGYHVQMKMADKDGTDCLWLTVMSGGIAEIKIGGFKSEFYFSASQVYSNFYIQDYDGKERFCLETTDKYNQLPDRDRPLNAVLLSLFDPSENVRSQWYVDGEGKAVFDLPVKNNEPKTQEK